MTPISGKIYASSDAKTNGNAFKQEANFASNGQILTGIYGNDSTVTFEGIEGTGKPQCVSFYYQSMTLPPLPYSPKLLFRLLFR